MPDRPLIDREMLTAVAPLAVTAGRASGDAVLRGVRFAGYAALACIAVGAPRLLSNGYDLNVLVEVAIKIALASSLAIVVQTGRMSLAQGTFAGIGGYVSGILVAQHEWNYWPALLAAGVTAAVFGILLGLTSLRLRGFYFAIATFAFSQIAIIGFSAWTPVTGGLNGMFGLAYPPPILGFDFADATVYYYVALILATLTIVLYHFLSAGTRFGRGLAVLGEDEVLAGAVGVPATFHRIAAFAISSLVAGIAGSLHTHFIQGISPPDLALEQSIFLLVMVMAGGTRSLIGPAVGAIILTVVPELLRASYQWSLVFYGAFLLVYVYLFRNGLVPLLDAWVSACVALARRPAAARSPHVGPAPARACPMPHRGDPTFAPILQLEHARCAFGDTVVLSDLNLTVSAGELRGIIGPNGAGKTTFFNLLTGMAPLAGGIIRLDGHAIRPTPAAVARRGVARTFQHPRLFDRRTVGQAVALAAELSGRSIDRGYLEWVVERTGLRSILHVTGGQLSHHQRRIVTIAMALAMRPLLVLLDEPTAGLDDTETASLKELIRNVHRELGCTILLIEHKLGLVMELCDKLTVLDYGEVIAEGDPAAVVRDPAVIQAYLGA